VQPFALSPVPRPAVPRSCGEIVDVTVLELGHQGMSRRGPDLPVVRRNTAASTEHGAQSTEPRAQCTEHGKGAHPADPMEFHGDLAGSARMVATANPDGRLVPQPRKAGVHGQGGFTETGRSAPGTTPLTLPGPARPVCRFSTAGIPPKRPAHLAPGIGASGINLHHSAPSGSDALPPPSAHPRRSGPMI
jgi:hypothetical protein